MFNTNDTNAKFKEVETEIRRIYPEISDSEISYIQSAQNLTMVSIPNSKLQIDEYMFDANAIKSNLGYLVFKLETTKRTENSKFKDVYDKKFTLLTKAGRPSKAAIDMEIMATDPSLRSMRLRLDSIDTMEEYLEFLVKVVDTYMDILKSRQFNL